MKKYNSDYIIKPGIGVGDFLLGSSLRDNESLIQEYADSSKSNFSRLVWLKIFIRDGILLTFDVYTNYLRIIDVFEYCGYFLEKFRIGMLISEAIKLDKRVYYEYGDECFCIDGIPGACLLIDWNDVDKAEQGDENIKIIGFSIFVPDYPATNSYYDDRGETNVTYIEL